MSNDRVALITGARGMDAAHMSQLLLEKGYVVYAMSRRSSAPNFWRLEALGIMDKVVHVDGDLTDQESLYRVMTKIKESHPNRVLEIYNLAANSFVGNSWSQPCVHLNINTIGPCNVMMSALRVFGNKGCKIYMAGSSEEFGAVREVPQTEVTPLNPRSPYGVSKCAMHQLAKNFRDSYDMFICVGILFNHESALRGDEFVTQKIVRSAVEYHYEGRPFELGNLDAKRDWGHAADYMRAAYMMMQADKPDDFVVSSGTTHYIAEFLDLVLDSLQIGHFISEPNTSGWKCFSSERCRPYKLIASCNPKFYRPAEVDLLLGDSSKIMAELGWKQNISFNELISEMVDSAKGRFKRGERLKNV